MLKAKIKEALFRCKMPWENGGHTLKITLSVGISCYPDEAKNAENLIATADEDLYSKKNSGMPGDPG